MMDENGNWREIRQEEGGGDGVEEKEEELMQVDEALDEAAHHSEETQALNNNDGDDDHHHHHPHPHHPKTHSSPGEPFNRYLFLSPRHEMYTPTRVASPLKDPPPTPMKPDFFVPKKEISWKTPVSSLPQSDTNMAVPRSQLPLPEVKGILKKGRSRCGEDQARAFYAKYEPRQILGNTVRLALDKTTNEEVAVKVIDVTEAARESNVTPDRIREESRREILLLELCQNSRHPNVVQLIAHYETTAYIFLVFELCREGDMFDFLNNGFHFSEKRTRYFMRQLFQVVDFLHSHRIVHRDLKLENILVTTPQASEENKDPQPLIKVADFGFAARIPEGHSLYERQGTVATMAPEVIAATEDMGYGLPIDLWACGVIMYTLLCGFPPFWRRCRAAMMRDILSGRYFFRSPLWDDVSDTPKDLISKLLVVDPSKRFTARQALNHPFFHLDVGSEKKVFRPRAVFRVAALAIRFYFRLRMVHGRPPGLPQELILQCPYSVKDVRTLIDSTAFRMYGHWVKRGGNQNRALLFQHERRG
ncbi:hypothetical protein ACOMHN_063222 [Nucella lapillus]